jgi:hypothetical protein
MIPVTHLRAAAADRCDRGWEGRTIGGAWQGTSDATNEPERAMSLAGAPGDGAPGML